MTSMNRSKRTDPITAFRNMETTVKTLAADSAVSAERALNADRQEGEALSFDDLRIAAPCDPDTVKPS
jgi:hypothetical protein